MNKKKVVIIAACAAVSALALAVLIPFIALGVKTSNLKADYEYLKTNEKYSTQVKVDGVELVEQHVSCGYASIEMISTYYGNKVSEDDLNARNSSVSTSSSAGFLNEINKSIPTKHFVKKSYLKTDALLKEIHNSLSANNPVALEWAAKYKDEWTLHFSVITGIDIAGDSITVNNPYGYIENITLKEFTERASFEAYKNIPLFLNFGFAFGAFEKNTVFIAEK